MWAMCSRVDQSRNWAKGKNKQTKKNVKSLDFEKCSWSFGELWSQSNNFKYHDLNLRLSCPPYEQRNLFIFSRRTRTELAQAWTVHTSPETNGQNREGSVLPSSPPRLAALHNFPQPYHHRANGNVGRRAVPATGQLDDRCRRCRLFERWERVDESRRVWAACMPSALFAGQKCWKGRISPTRDLWWRDATAQARSDRWEGGQMFVLAFASAAGNDDRLHILSFL